MIETIKYSIEPSQEPGFPTIEVTESGKVTYLHSRIAPHKEKDSLKSVIDSITQDTVIVYGSGLGYSIEPLLDNRFIRKIIVIERLPQIENHIHNLFTRTHQCEIIYISGLDYDMLETRLLEAIDFLTSKGFAFLDHPASLRIFSDYYSRAKSIVDQIIRSKAGNAATLKSFSSLYLKNAVKNIIAGTDMCSLSSLTGLWSNLPCVIISSAPSIDTYIDIIKRNTDRLMILAVDSAYPVCAANGIIPDLIITVDPQPWTTEHLLNMDKAIPVITSVTAYHHLFKKTVLSLNTHPLSQVIEHFFPNTGSADSHTGTVAGDAIVTASILGSSRIYLSGLDFSFPNRLIYGKDSAYNHRYSFIFNNRLNSVENSHIRYVRKSSLSTRVDNIPTRNSFIQYRDSVSSLVSSMRNVEFIHLINGGLHIPGTTKVLSPEEATTYINNEKQIESKTDISERINTLTIRNQLNKGMIKDIFSDTTLLTQVINASLDTASDSGRLNKTLTFIKHLLETL